MQVMCGDAAWYSSFAFQVCNIFSPAVLYLRTGAAHRFRIFITRQIHPMQPSPHPDRRVLQFFTTAIFVAVVLLPAALHAQPDLTFKRIRLDWPYVEVYLSVGCDGIKNYSLQRGDIEIVEDDKVLDDFGIWCPDPTSRCPISVGLVFDASDSMVGEGNAGAKRGGLQFVENMDSFVDEACVIQFNSDVTIWQYMTTDTVLLKKAVNRLPAIGATALWDGIYNGLLLTQSQGHNQCRAVIVLTDGEDNSSSRNLEEVIAYAVTHNIRVFPIGYGKDIREDQLSHLAQITGGNYYQTPDSTGLSGIYREISTVIYEFFQECIIDYEPRCADGKLHEVELRIPDLCNGSATKTRWYKAPLDSATFFTRHLALGDVTVAGGEEAWVPLEMISPVFRDNFYPFTLDLRYDRQRLQLDRVETPAGTLLSGMDVHTANLSAGARLRFPEVRVLDSTGVMCYAVFRTSTAQENVSLPVRVDSTAIDMGCLVPVVTDGMVRLTPSAPGVGCTVSAPTALQWDPLTSQYNPSPFEVRMQLENRGTLPAMGGAIRLNIDPAVYAFVEPATAVQTISDIPLEGVREVIWKIRARPQGEDITAEICFTATFDNHPNVVCCKQQEIIAAGAVLSCGYTYPELRYDESTQSFVPNPFVLRMTVDNIGDVASGALDATLQLPAGLYLESGQTARKSLVPGEIAPGVSAEVSWTLRVVSLLGGDHFPIRAMLRNAGREYRSCTDTLILPFVPPAFTTDITVEGSTTRCAGDSVVLDAGAGFPQYRWSTGAQTRKITVRRSGTYTVSVLDGQGRVGRSNSIEVRIESVPDRPVIIREHNTLITTASPPLQWYHNGTAIPGATSSRLVVTEIGRYEVESWFVPLCRVMSPAFSVVALGTGSTPVAGSLAMDAYPDPAHGRVTVAVRSGIGGSAVVRLHSVLGRVLRERRIQLTPGTQTLSFELDDLPRGMYMLTCSNARSTVLRKILLQ